MPPSDLKLRAELEACVEAAARASGKAPRNILIETVEAYFAGVTEDRISFVSEALAARKEFERTGLAYDADDVFDYLLERAKGQTIPRSLRLGSGLWCSSCPHELNQTSFGSSSSTQRKIWDSQLA